MNNINQTMHRMKEGPSHPSPTKKRAPQKPNRANQATGALVLLIMAGAFWIYGYGGQIRNAATSNSPTSTTKIILTSSTTITTQTLLGNMYVVSTIFVVLGFGLLLAYFKKATGSALFTVLFIVSYTAILSPILQKFWFNIFITNFQGAAPTATDPARLYKYSMGGLEVYLDFYNLRIALANAIGQLVVLLGVFGRLSMPQVVIHSTLFNLCWNLNHFLCVLLANNSPDSRFFDDYQISSVYLFSASYGLILSLILKAPKTPQLDSFCSSQKSSVLAHLGTFFLFMAFTTTTTLFALKYTLTSSNESARAYIWQEAFISVFFSLSASVIFNYAIGIVINPTTKIGIRGSLLGTITGAIMYGSVAGTAIKIGAAIAVGLVAGATSAFFYQKIYSKMNGNIVRDSFGMTSIWIAAFVGTFLIAPTVLKTYYNYQVSLSTLQPQSSPAGGYFIMSKDVAGWALVYVGISVGIGLTGGILIGLLLKTIERAVMHFNDAEFYQPSPYGLRVNRSEKYVDRANRVTKNHHQQPSAEIIIT